LSNARENHCTAPRKWLVAIVIAIGVLMVPASAEAWGGMLLPDRVDSGTDFDPPRFYVSALVGASFATLVQPELPGTPAIDEQSLLTGGAAAGWAIPRPCGGMRLEGEFLAREPMEVRDSDPLVGTLEIAARDGWSTMVNLWRDVDMTDRLAVYGGGGVGAGGYRLTFSGNAPGASVAGSTQVASFAWQAGGGIAYAVTDRITLDLGYRFLSFEPGSGELLVTNSAGTVQDTYATQFMANELLLSVRVYEPFRRWRR
jgi:hypothetical protein